MFLSTQSVSRPKRDSIYSFPRHLGPLGCIKIAIFNEKANLSKNRFHEKNYTLVSTDHQVQFLNGFAIFHKPQHTQSLWQIAKKTNSIVKFVCGNECVKVFFLFFRNWEFILPKFVKNFKKIKNHLFLLKKVYLST